MSVVRNITGTYDILPYAISSDGAHEHASWMWQYVEKTIADVLNRYAFSEIRTPVLEPTELIARGIGALTDIVSKEMFAFEREDTQYVLRPEVTAPVMRAYLQHHLDQQGGIQKLYYIGPCFRAERPQKGRYRQFYQFGCEIIGADGPLADAEAISAMMAVYKAFDIGNMRLRINSLGDENSRPKYRKALQAYFKPYESDLSETSRRRLEQNPLRILDTKDENERRLLDDAPLLTDFIDDDSRAAYETLKGLLSDMGIAYQEDPFLVRGLDYYTRTAFELESDDLGAQSALAGGGRYDLLALEVGSKKPVPAVGFAAGMERLFIALTEAGKPFPDAPSPDVYIVSLGEEALLWGLPEANRFRAAGLKVALDLKGRSMKAQMREANRLGVRFVVIVGSNELQTQKVTVKNMETSEQEDVLLDGLSDYLKQQTAL